MSSAIATVRWRRSASSRTRTASPGCASTTASKKEAAPAFVSTPGRHGCPCCCTPRPRARCSSASAPASPRARPPRIPTLQVDAVELLPEVIEASAQFRGVRRADPSRLHVMAADARRYVRAERSPLRRHRLGQLPPGPQRIGSLYTVEHFEAVERRLNADGLFCQWLPLHQLDLETLRSIVRSFLTAFPHGLRRCSRATASRRRCWGWSGAPTGAASTPRPSTIAWRASRCPGG